MAVPDLYGSLIANSGHLVRSTAPAEPHRNRRWSDTLVACFIVYTRQCGAPWRCWD
jgi:hypothetical protein